MGRRVFVTGCSGYLAQVMIEACLQDDSIEWFGGIDVKPPRNTERFHFFNLDIRSAELAVLLKDNQIDTVVHLAWVFNPTHNPGLEYEVDVGGTTNVLHAIKSAQVPYLIYLSSTTSYGPHFDNPPVFDEDYPRRGHWSYTYSKYKAEVDHIMMGFIKENPQIRVFMTRAAIVLGPHTKNIVTQMTEMPVMFAVRDFDPPMQFVHEEDMQRVLIWAVKEQPEGVFNLSSHGIIQYSKLVHLLKKPMLALPASMLYPSLAGLWKMHLLPFPPSILDFIRYPWVGSIQKFLDNCKIELRYTSEEALMAYAKARWPGKY